MFCGPGRASAAPRPVTEWRIHMPFFPLSSVEGALQAPSHAREPVSLGFLRTVRMQMHICSAAHRPVHKVCKAEVVRPSILSVSHACVRFRGGTWSRAYICMYVCTAVSWALGWVGILLLGTARVLHASKPGACTTRHLGFCARLPPEICANQLLLTCTIR